MNDTRLLNELKKAQADYALAALSKPSDKSLFEYGHRAGFVAGLECAVELLLKQLSDEKHGNNDL